MDAADRHVLIVGAGVTGLLTAVRCALAGQRVTVLDRGPIPNPASTSFDQHRALRALDPRDQRATGRGAWLHREWLKLEALLGTRLYRRVGVVTAWPAGQAVTVAAAGAAAGVPVEVVGPESLPPFRFPTGHVGVREEDAGVLLADRVLRAAAAWLRAQDPVRLLPGREVADVDADTGRVLLRDGRRLDADLVVLAAGPWLPGLIETPLVVHRQSMVYLRPPERLGRWWAAAPSAGGLGSDGTSWLLPPGDGTLLKLSSDAVCHPLPARGWSSVQPLDTRALVSTVLHDATGYQIDHVKECHYITGAPPLTRIGPTVWACVSGPDGFRTAPLTAARIATLTPDAFPAPVNRKETA